MSSSNGVVEADVAVVGAGIAGCTAATLFSADHRPGTGLGCSWAFQLAGWLVDATADALRDQNRLDCALRRYRRRHRAELAGHQRLIAQGSKGGPLSPVERLFLSAATKDPETARHLYAFATRIIPPRRFLAPRAVHAEAKETDERLANTHRCRAGMGSGSTLAKAGPAGPPAAAEAARYNLEVLRARAAELEREDVAYGVARQLPEARVVRMAPRDRSRLLSGAARHAADALGLEGAAAADVTVLHGLYWMCAGLTEHRPLALLVVEAGRTHAQPSSPPLGRRAHPVAARARGCAGRCAGVRRARSGPRPAHARGHRGPHAAGP